MNFRMVVWLGMTLMVGVAGVGLAATGRPFAGISVAVFSVAMAHLSRVDRHV